MYPTKEACSHILWPAIISHPDVQFSIGTLAQYTQSHGQPHWNTIKHVIKYLYTTRKIWLIFGGKIDDLHGYTDADWGSQSHRHSISGYTFSLGDRCVTWSSKKQSIVVLSSTKAEYVATTHACEEALWLRSLIQQFGTPLHLPMTLLCDNQLAIALVKDNKFHARTKHIDICHHFIQDAIEMEYITLQYVPTEENVANIFTKPFPYPKFEYFINVLGLHYA